MYYFSRGDFYLLYVEDISFKGSVDELKLNIFVIVWQCYIGYGMDFRFVPGDPVCFAKLSRCD